MTESVGDTEFDRFWNTLSAELDTLPAAAEESEIPLRSDEHCTCFSVRLRVCSSVQRRRTDTPLWIMGR